MKKQSLASRVLAFLKGGDEAKLSRFEGKVDKYFEKQIKMREDSIETLQDKLVDAKEALQETIVSVDPARINSTEDAESYVVTYIRGVQAKRDVVASLEEQVTTLQAEIDSLKETQEAIYSVSAE